MADRPQPIARNTAFVDINRATIGASMMEQIAFLVRTVEYQDAFNAYHEGFTIGAGQPLTTGFIMVGDDGISATTYTEVPPVFGGADSTLYMEDTAYA